MARTGWRRFLPFPRRAWLRRALPSFETRNIVHLIAQSGADRVVDLGANEGQFVRRIRSAGCRLPALSVEPRGGAHRRRAAAAARDPLWEVAPPVAIGRAPGRLRITRYADATLSSALPPHPRAARSPALRPVAAEDVPVTTLDALMADRPGRPFLKLDLQGAELDAIEGGPETLARAAGLMVELSLTPSYDGEPSYLEILGRLDSLGFVPVYCCPVIARRRLGAWLQMDAVLLRRERV